MSILFTGVLALAASGTVANGGPVTAGPVAAESASTDGAAGNAILRVTPSATQIRVGETLAFVAEVTNTTASDLVGLRAASDTSDEVASLLGARTDLGVFDPVTATWFIDRIPPGSTATLEIFARADASGTAEIVLLAAADEPAGTLGSVNSSVEVLSESADTEETGSTPGFTAGVLLTAGGALIAVAGLLHLHRRRRGREVLPLAQVASDPE